MDIEYYLWLRNVAGVSNSVCARLVNYFGSAKSVYENDDINLLSTIEGISQKTAKALVENKSFDEIKEKLEYLETHGTKYITYESESYPKLLSEIYDPPAVIYYKGENLFKDINIAIAVVGARKSSRYGENAAHVLSSQLAGAGIVIVSGLARGIDRWAHEGALDASGLTIGVLGCGIDVIYPPENKALYERILSAKGMIISEFAPQQAPLPNLFPSRNRIISALSFGTLIVQASFQSGSLITAKCAAEQGREVYAVPGEIFNLLSEGTNMLIKDGAKPVSCANDILEDLFNVLRPIVKNTQPENVLILNEEENALISAVLAGTQTPDALGRELNMSSPKLSALITSLELKQAISVKMGVVYATYRR